jgi:Spy/CpxP family protein refolding chaperone
MKKTLLLLTLLLCFGTIAAQSIGPMERGFRGPEIQAEKLKAYLNLTDQQWTDLQAVQTAFREASQPTQEKMAQKSQTLRQTMEQGTADQTTMTQLKSEMETLRTEVQTLRATYRTRSLALLTDDQKTSLAALEKAMELMGTAREAMFWNLIESTKGSPEGGMGMAGGPGHGPAPMGLEGRPPFNR